MIPARGRRVIRRGALVSSVLMGTASLPAFAPAAPATRAVSTNDPPPPARVEFVAHDGLMLHGTYWAATQPGPAMLLLHQCNADHTGWAPLAAAFAKAGVHVLAFDFRGFGESRGPRAEDFAEESERLWPDFTSDVDRALAYLRTLPDVDGKRIGAIGASCGGSQALLLAMREPAIQAVGFLSSSLPRLGEQDLVQFEANTSLPVLAIAAEEDAAARAQAERLFARASDGKSKLVLYKGKLHGVPLFELDPGLADAIAAWFAAAL